MEGFAVLGHEWCLGIGCRGITTLDNMGEVALRMAAKSCEVG